MLHAAVIHDTPHEIHQHRDHHDDPEHAPGPETGLHGPQTRAGGFGAYLEEVGALVRVGADEGGDGGGFEGVFFAVEGDEGGFSAFGGDGFLRFFVFVVIGGADYLAAECPGRVFVVV